MAAVNAKRQLKWYAIILFATDAVSLGERGKKLRIITIIINYKVWILLVCSGF
jgi:hypothetical protein